MAKLNAHELGLTFTRELRTRFDRIAAATELQRRGAQWVLVTDGARPALIVGADGAWSATAPQIETVNAVGSGDACTAGLIAAHLAGERMPDAMALGFGAGAANALTQTPADFDPATARNLARAVSFKALA